MARPNYSHEKRMRELKKQKKKEQKAQRKAERAEPTDSGEASPPGNDQAS